MTESYLESVISCSENVKDFGICSVDLLKGSRGDTDTGLDFLFELGADTILVYDFLSECQGELREAVNSKECKFSLAALSCIEEYLEMLDAFDASYLGRIHLYREATKGDTNLVLLDTYRLSGFEYVKSSRPKPFHFYEIFGNPNIERSDIDEYLFGVGVTHEFSMADNKSLLTAVRSLMRLLLNIREIFFRGLSAINALCPVWGEAKVKKAVSYFKTQIEAVNNREAALERASKPNIPYLQLVR